MSILSASVLTRRPTVGAIVATDNQKSLEIPADQP
jgi:hypothetical protein